jgi:hypothetical protein
LRAGYAWGGIFDVGALSGKYVLVNLGSELVPLLRQGEKVVPGSVPQSCKRAVYGAGGIRWRAVRDGAAVHGTERV